MYTSKQRGKMMIDLLYKCLKIIFNRKANGREARDKKKTISVEHTFGYSKNNAT